MASACARGAQAPRLCPEGGARRRLPCGVVAVPVCQWSLMFRSPLKPGQGLF